MYKRTSFFTVTVSIVLLVVLLTGCAGNTPANTQADGNKGAMKPMVRPTAVKRTDLTRTLMLSGKVTPAAETPIIAKYSGTVQSVQVEVGQWVESGQVLVSLDATDAALNTLTAEASFLAGYEKAKTDYEVAQAQYERYRSLYEQQAVAKATVEAEQQKAAAAKAALESWTRQMGSSNVPASVDLLKRKQDDMMLRAPFSGLIAQKQVNPGEQVTATQTLMTVVDLSRVYIDCNVAESEVGILKLGLPVEVQVDSTMQSYQGSITHISPAADPKTKTFFVRVTLAAPDERLKGGMFARFSVKPTIRSNIIAIPQSALLEQGSENYVYVIGEGEVLEKRKVEVGLRDDTMVEIRSGLQEGLRVVTEVTPNLRDKMPVQVPSASNGAQKSGGAGKP